MRPASAVVFEMLWIPHWFEERRGPTPASLVTPGSRASCSVRDAVRLLDLLYNDAMLRFHVGREKADFGFDAKKAWRPSLLV